MLRRATKQQAAGLCFSNPRHGLMPPGWVNCYDSKSLCAWQKSISRLYLDPTELTRLIYMDESGTSAREPSLYVAAVIIHADTQLVPVEDRLREVVDAYISKKRRDGFVFHAADLFSGTKKTLPPEIWQEEIRWKMLEEIMAIPAKLNLPVCFGMVQKQKFRMFNEKANGASEQKIREAMHATAIAICTMACEGWMRGRANSEVAMLFAENNDEIKKAAKATQILMRSKNALQYFTQIRTEKPNLPLIKIKDAINFVTKPESFALQLADACAWAVRKLGSKDERYSRFCSILKPQISLFSMTSYDVAGRLGVPPTQKARLFSPLQET